MSTIFKGVKSLDLPEIMTLVKINRNMSLALAVCDPVSYSTLTDVTDEALRKYYATLKVAICSVDDLIDLISSLKVGRRLYGNPSLYNSKFDSYTYDSLYHLITNNKRFIHVLDIVRPYQITPIRTSINFNTNYREKMKLSN